MVIGMREGIEENSRDNFLLTVCLKFLQCENVYRAPLQYFNSDQRWITFKHFTSDLDASVTVSMRVDTFHVKGPGPIVRDLGSNPSSGTNHLSDLKLITVSLRSYPALLFQLLVR